MADCRPLQKCCPTDAAAPDGAAQAPGPMARLGQYALAEIAPVGSAGAIPATGQRHPNRVQALDDEPCSMARLAAVKSTVGSRHLAGTTSRSSIGPSFAHHHRCRSGSASMTVQCPSRCNNTSAGQASVTSRSASMSSDYPPSGSPSIRAFRQPSRRPPSASRELCIKPSRNSAEVVEDTKSDDVPDIAIKE